MEGAECRGPSLGDVWGQQALSHFGSGWARMNGNEFMGHLGLHESLGVAVQEEGEEETDESEYEGDVSKYVVELPAKENGDGEGDHGTQEAELDPANISSGGSSSIIAPAPPPWAAATAADPPPHIPTVDWDDLGLVESIVNDRTAQASLPYQNQGRSKKTEEILNRFGLGHGSQGLEWSNRAQQGLACFESFVRDFTRNRIKPPFPLSPSTFPSVADLAAFIRGDPTFTAKMARRRAGEEQGPDATAWADEDLVRACLQVECKLGLYLSFCSKELAGTRKQLRVLHYPEHWHCRQCKVCRSSDWWHCGGCSKCVLQVPCPNCEPFLLGQRKLQESYLRQSTPPQQKH